MASNSKAAGSSSGRGGTNEQEAPPQSKQVSGLGRRDYRLHFDYAHSGGEHVIHDAGLAVEGTKGTGRTCHGPSRNQPGGSHYTKWNK